MCSIEVMCSNIEHLLFLLFIVFALIDVVYEQFICRRSRIDIIIIVKLFVLIKGLGFNKLASLKPFASILLYKVITLLRQSSIDCNKRYLI